jgi:hypothetical protein
VVAPNNRVRVRVMILVVGFVAGEVRKVRGGVAGPTASGGAVGRQGGGGAVSAASNVREGQSDCGWTHGGP